MIGSMHGHLYLPGRPVVVRQVLLAMVFYQPDDDQGMMRGSIFFAQEMMMASAPWLAEKP
jgi:hypothetical protein